MRPVNAISDSRSDSRQGFTMVEIVLALLVVSIGLLAVLGLMSGGLQLSSDSASDAHASMYARMVFDGYRAEFARDSNAWANATSVQLEPLGDGVWRHTGTEPYDLGPLVTNVPRTIVFEHQTTDIEDFALRYRLSFQNEGSNLKSATLEVWPRQFGPTLPGNAIIFYTEYYDIKRP